MGDGSHNNAMAECALALAMAFFSIRVLTMVSMGAGVAARPAGSPPAAERISLRPSTPSEAAAQNETTGQGTIIIHYRGRFYDRDLTPLTPENIPSDGHTILAIDPLSSDGESVSD